jgi:hypothetical protein
MTYWPISSPSVFAATKHTLPAHPQISHDGAEPTSSEPVADEGTQSSVTGSEERAEGNEASEDDISGEIIAIKVTRSGHMFATATRATLTIWQTKACSPSCPGMFAVC